MANEVSYSGKYLAEATLKDFSKNNPFHQPFYLRPMFSGSTKMENWTKVG